MNKILGALIQKLTTPKFASSLIILLLTQLAERTENQLDDKLVALVREALEEKPEGNSP